MCVCCYLLLVGGQGGGKWLFVLSELDLLIMVIALTVTHRSDTDRNISTEREAIKLENSEKFKGFTSIMTYLVVCLSVVILSIMSPFQDKCTFVNADSEFQF